MQVFTRAAKIKVLGCMETFCWISCIDFYFFSPQFKWPSASVFRKMLQHWFTVKLQKWTIKLHLNVHQHLDVCIMTEFSIVGELLWVALLFHWYITAQIVWDRLLDCRDVWNHPLKIVFRKLNILIPSELAGLDWSLLRVAANKW